MEKRNLFGRCPYVTAQKVLTGKWSMYIMYLLSDGPVRFNELLRRMPEEMTQGVRTFYWTTHLVQVFVRTLNGSV